MRAARQRSLKRIVKMFFALSISLMFAGLFAEIALVVSRMPVGYVNSSVAIAILGFTMLPAGEVIEWFLPWEGRYTRLTRGLALFGTGVTRGD